MPPKIATISRSPTNKKHWHGLTMIPHKKKHVRIQGGDLNQSNLQQLSLGIKVIPSPSPCWATVFSNCPGGVGMVARRCNALPKGLPGATGEDPGALAFGMGVWFCCFTWRKRKKTPGWLVYSSKEMMLMLLLLLLLFSDQVWKVWMVSDSTLRLKQSTDFVGS